MTRDDRGPVGAGLAIAMTDLFLSASGALLLVLALLRPDPVTPLPIQADILASCAENAGKTITMWAPGDTLKVDVATPKALPGVPAALGLEPRPFYSIALLPDANGLLSAGCLRTALIELVREYNANIADLTRQGEARPVFGLSPSPTSAENSSP